jgi:antitoxin component YwqK of YwqJK toxin-antitoxin module
MGRAMSNAEVKKEYYPNGNIWNEYYYLDGLRHREDGPARICYYMNGNIWHEEYYINGIKHREGGPAYIWHSDKGDLQYESYYILGIQVSKEDWYSRLSAEQKVNLLYGKGNE